jgi:two-component system, cell cycle sensor histidine kinase and response regulator CckA
MLFYLWICQGRSKLCILGARFRYATFPNTARVAGALLGVSGFASASLAQEPRGSISSVAAAQLETWPLTYVLLAAVVVLATIVVMILFNYKLEGELHQRKRVEKRLRTAERVKTELLDSMDDSVIYLDTDQRLRWANNSARGGPKPIPENSLGEYCYAIWGDGDGPCEGCPVPQTLAEGCTRQNKAVRDNKGRCWRVHSCPVKSDSGILRGVVVISRDVTEELLKEEELLKIRKLESVGVLAGGIAHDFNNVLTAVMGYISLAELKQAGNGETETYLRKATAAADRAKQLAARLLTFSQGGHPVRRQVGVENLITKAVANAARNHPVSVRTEIDPQCRLLLCDQDQMLQALRNVIVNACESMPTGGEVLIKADCTHIEADFNAVLLPGGYLHISISDRGAGIPATITGKIFDPYFTTKPMGAEKGCGLGLAITHSIVHKHQGYVSVAQRPGGGTTVNILLPLDAANPHKVEATVLAKVKKPPQKGERILVLEDEDLVGEVAKMLLSHLGYRVTHASHGEAAVDQFKAAQAAGDPFGTVILDLTIKGGMGGRETLEALKRYDPGVRAFLSSGYSRDPLLTDFSRYGFSGVIPKPYTLEEVKRVLAKTPPPLAPPSH